MEEKNRLVIERVFDAPVEIVWKYWSDPQYFMRWWGPKDFTAPVAKIDFKVGEKYLCAMQDPSGKRYFSTGTYQEIIPLEKIVVTDSFADENGNIVPSTYYGMEGFPLELEIKIQFEKLNGKTKMILTHSGIRSIDDKMRNDMEQGWNQSFDKIDNDLKK